MANKKENELDLFEKIVIGIGAIPGLYMYILIVNKLGDRPKGQIIGVFAAMGVGLLVCIIFNIIRAMWMDSSAEDSVEDKQEIKPKDCELMKLASYDVAQNGDAVAQCDIGSCFFYGKGVAKNYLKALLWYKKSADQGYAQAQYNLGLCCYNGYGLAQNYSDAINWYKKAAEQGHAMAQNDLGKCYECGIGVLQDYKTAVFWYKKAAVQGLPQAQQNLSNCYRNGYGVEQNEEKALKWYKKAVNQGYEKEISDLENHLQKQIEAKDKFENSGSITELLFNRVDDNLKDITIINKKNNLDYDRNDIESLRKAANAENMEAQYDLGRRYYYGEEIEKDYEEAQKWYQKAADQGHEKAQKRLEKLINVLSQIQFEEQLREVDCNGVKLELVKIKAGSFMMGSPKEDKGNIDEELHQVTLTKDYWLGKFPVTQEQYEAIMGINPSFFKGEKRPVEMIYWDDAKRFCEKLNKKYGDELPQGYQFDLPTEAQWEYACRAGTTTAFSYGNDSDIGKMNFDGKRPYHDGKEGISHRETIDVGSLDYQNAWGLCDMHGNVYEWCRDWYDQYEDNVVDPVGPSNGLSRVLRGGSWGDRAELCRSARRRNRNPNHRNYYLGFRLALVSA